jgi:hypothetical protein
MKLLTMPIWSGMLHVYSWVNLTISDLTLRSLIHFELMLIQGERWGSSFSLLQVEIQFILGTFVDNQMAVVVWVCVLNFFSITLLFISVLGLVPCCFLPQLSRVL